MPYTRVTRWGTGTVTSQTPDKRQLVFEATLEVQETAAGQTVGAPWTTKLLIKIDLDAIARKMGYKALRAKCRKCTDGFVTVTSEK